MPASTSNFNIPYPIDADPIDVTADMKKLADRVDQLLSKVGVVRLGTYIPWHDDGKAPPTGTLRCDGSTFVGATYPELATHLGTNTLPDLRGQFLRGADGTWSPGKFGGAADVATVNHVHAKGGLSVAKHKHGRGSLIVSEVNISHVHSTPAHRHRTKTAFANVVTGGHSSGDARMVASGTGYGPFHTTTISTTPWSNTNEGASTTGSGGATKHKHTISGSTADATAAITGDTGDPVGGVEKQNTNLPPFYTVTWLIQATLLN